MLNKEESVLLNVFLLYQITRKFQNIRKKDEKKGSLFFNEVKVARGGWSFL